MMLGLWGMESAFGDVVVNPKHMRPILPALAALAWGEPRRRSYWEQELLNALVIVERGWGTPSDMIGSWAGAMGHTQWMPEVWLNMGVDFNGDGRISPFGPPDDALAGTAQYILRARQISARRRLGLRSAAARRLPRKHGNAAISSWQEHGVRRANGNMFPGPPSRHACGSR